MYASPSHIVSPSTIQSITLSYPSNSFVSLLNEGNEIQANNWFFENINDYISSYVTPFFDLCSKAFEYMSSYASSLLITCSEPFVWLFLYIQSLLRICFVHFVWLAASAQSVLENVKNMDLLTQSVVKNTTNVTSLAQFVLKNATKVASIMEASYPIRIEHTLDHMTNSFRSLIQYQCINQFAEIAP